MNNQRLGMTFDTSENGHYFYDSGTGKVVECDIEEIKFINKILCNEISLEDACITKPDFADFIKTENLFTCPKERKFRHPKLEEYKEMVKSSCEQIVLELTEKCNLRCGYCIYNEHHPKYRGFSHRNMSFDVAKESIDYLLTNFKKDKIALTFYGGEPLLNFDLMRQCIEYTKNQYSHLKLSYAFTTNATLITEEMVAYFKTLEDIDILCSVDGPKEMHDKYRKDLSGNGSFDAAIAGVQLLIDKFYNAEKKRTISINSVLEPPYSKKKLVEVKTFLENELGLPKEVSCSYNYIDIGDMSFDFDMNEMITDEIPSIEGINPLEQWAADGFIEKREDSKYFNMIEKDLYRVANRLRAADGLIDETFLHGNCIPGQRRVYVTVDGDFKLCENAANTPLLGNYRNGFKFDEIYKMYIHDYMEYFGNKCDNCWARPMCGVCYQYSMSGTGEIPYTTESVCNIETRSIKDMFILYYRLFEIDKEGLEENLSKVEIS